MLNDEEMKKKSLEEARVRHRQLTSQEKAALKVARRRHQLDLRAKIMERLQLFESYNRISVQNNNAKKKKNSSVSYFTKSFKGLSVTPPESPSHSASPKKKQQQQQSTPIPIGAWKPIFSAQGKSASGSITSKLNSSTQSMALKKTSGPSSALKSVFYEPLDLLIVAFEDSKIRKKSKLSYLSIII